MHHLTDDPGSLKVIVGGHDGQFVCSPCWLSFVNSIGQALGLCHVRVGILYLASPLRKEKGEGEPCSFPLSGIDGCRIREIQFVVDLGYYLACYYIGTTMHDWEEGETQGQSHICHHYFRESSAGVKCPFERLVIIGHTRCRSR